LRRSSPPSDVGGDQDLPADGHEEVTVIITESDQILETLRCGSAPNSASVAMALVRFCCGSGSAGPGQTVTRRVVA
jgi:hypothetical protein